MKKSINILIVITLAIILGACGGDEKKSASGDKGLDGTLDRYEEFVDEYIALVKKAAAGDLSAFSDYAAVMEKAEALNNTLTEDEDQLSAAQIQRMMKIQMKMANAAMEMQ